ncbi:MAG: hypothetical protein QOK14_1849, partial [Frankiaceae bacterium]|nr:hypothetical protein [Frankiaceae bacterium]
DADADPDAAAPVDGDLALGDEIPAQL